MELLMLIRWFRCQHDLNNDKTSAVTSLLKNLLYLYQKPEETNDEYLKEFNARVESMDDYGACMLQKSPCLVEDKMMEKFDKMMEEAMQQEAEECEKAVKKETMAALLLHGADKVRCGGLKSTLSQNMSMGMNNIQGQQKKHSTCLTPIAKQ